VPWAEKSSLATGDSASHALSIEQRPFRYGSREVQGLKTFGVVILMSFKLMSFKSARRVLGRFFLGKSRLRALESKYTTPPTLYIECTNRCNARCVFCVYPKLESTLSTKILSLEDFDNVIHQYRSMGGTRVALTPTLADPLTDPHIADRFDLLEKSGIEEVSLYTNLISFGSGVQKALRNERSLRIKIHVSFVGFCPKDYQEFMGVDRFDRVREHLVRLCQIQNERPNLDVRVVLRDYKDSSKSKNEMLEFLKLAGLAYDIQTHFDTWGGEVEDSIVNNNRLYIKKRRKRIGPCKISFLKPLVTVEGNLKLCDCRDAYGDLEVGNVLQDRLEELWKGQRVRELRELFYTPSLLPKICQKCEYYKSIYD
jgi:radical SAM protein with 4Fe4S-binding SPASM domain